MINLLLRSCLQGILVGWAFLAVMLVFNIGELGARVLGSSNPILGVFLLAFGLGSTFGSVSMGAAIMSIPSNKDVTFNSENLNTDYKFPY